ncbi:inactive hydroxysteroid dehydrogenase-like protein 1 [Hemicordylus capensis]|uniref:inactive hydroxysteroid dehydrogenase-like protein 1 n=1 Tax=Hemicordylus capensis TaxID=884348 RepID=UPI002303AA35|nr:inactive hydroxysteroid dehydrogenase-like protein 1 [Hemicordylus capensis]XP_053126793.1 inactive hydroxysteroid dehydrogenase-like protein 1 [Hemicordylus capensis]XP_053126794.1 inactive hydroxysteroid dehydrogenase-like protein 1 [Hemicordylus capensis]
MAAVDSFSLLLREIGRSCNCYMETLAFIGALYTAKTCFTFANDTYTLIRLHFIPRLISRADLVKLYGKWAVVTGCTSGIGKSYAKELASHGMNIILISRNKEKLEALAKEIVDAYKVETAIIVVDFGEGREIYPAVKKALMGKEIGILVNNVGVFYNHPDYFANLTQDKIWELINVNIGAVNMMVHMVLPGMVERKKGAVVNVSSIFCCQPTPQMTAYSASKAYLDHFSRALHYEYAPKGIFVQSLIPFFIAADSKSKCFFVPSAEEYAHHAVTTLGISKRTTGYWLHSILFLLGQYIPEWLWAWGSYRTGNSLGKEATLQRLP